MRTAFCIFTALFLLSPGYGQKKAVPLEKSLAILQDEAAHNKLDPELVKIFIQNKIYEKVNKNSFKGENP